jgi:hypothetical protein
MSIDKVMDAAAEYRDASTFSGQCVAKINLRAAIAQHVSEAVAAEREALLDLVDDYAKGNADLKDAIRARADHDEVTQ